MPSSSTNAPFLEAHSFALNQEVYETEPQAASPPNHAFLPVYAQEGFAAPYDVNTEAYVTFLNELYDEEFDEALYELVDEASSLYQDRMRSEFDPEQMLMQHFAPLGREAEAMFGTLAQNFGQREITRLTDSEIDAAVDQYLPTTPLTPSFEHFWGGLKNLAKKAIKGATNLAKKGISLAAKLGLGPLL